MECKVCGREFNIASHRIKTAKYCSRACKNSKRKPINYKSCKYCGKKMPIYYNTPKKKWCSSKCAQNNFHKLRPNARKEYGIKFRSKIPKLCKICGKEIPRGSHHRLCYICIPIQIVKSNKKCRDKMSKAFRQYKEKRGCKLCGYNKYGGSLDFHHKKDKQSRIQLTDWYTRNKIWKQESKKCILICKNCHYELHHN